MGDSRENIAFLCQLVFGYLSKRPDGHRILYKLLKLAGFKAEKASYLKTYYKEGYLGMDEHKIPYSKLEELKVWLYDDKRVLPFDMVEILDRPDHTPCDDCGILVPTVYCSATVREFNNGREHLVTLCNHCRANKEDPKIRDTAKRATCEDCKLQNCTYWKEYHRARVEEPVSRTASPQIQRQLEHKPTPFQERYGAI